MLEDVKAEVVGDGEKSPKISVIVPVYKVEKYLPECIESVLAQTFTDFELILVDDGSPDNSGKICDDYAKKDPRIRVFHKENGGVSSARNLGLDNARGEWIVFVDSDDTVREKYLEHLWGKGPTPGTLVLAGLIFFDANGREVRRAEFPSGEGFVKEVFLKEQLYHFGYPFSKLYDACIIDANQLRFDSEISMAEDLLFMGVYLCLVKSIVLRKAADYNYYVRIGSLSRRFETFESGIQLFLRVREMFGQLGGGHFSTPERKSLKWFFFRAVFTLYYPHKRPTSKVRMEKLQEAFSILTDEFNECDCRIHERLFMRGFFRCFDFVMLAFYQLRYYKEK